ncbi:unnamed protein product [Discula destructiva]
MGFNSKISAVVLAAASLLPFTHAAVPEIEGFTLTWSDDFVGTANSLPNTADWTAVPGTQYPGGAPNWGTGEIQTHTSSTENVALTGNSVMGITAIRDSSGAWTSARLETVRSDFTCEAGAKMRIQGSLSLPVLGENGIGYWPAFWSLGGNFRQNVTNWPAVGEFDIMENINGINRVYGTMHCGIYGGGPCDETNGLSGSTVPSGSALQGNFHTYTFELDRTDASLEVARWYLDGTLYWQVTSDVMDAATWAEAAHNTYFIIVNLAIGGSFPNKVYGGATPIASTQSSGTLLVDYVAVYNS